MEVDGPKSESLVRYDTPMLVSTTPPSHQSKKKKLETTSATEDILNTILPPREWTEGGQLWVQYVSSTPATRLEVISLRDLLDRKLQEKQARETGVCPVREELYAQCLDEVIRQVTISCAERGLLLLRVRDEIRMTISAYQTLYESSVAYGMRKALSAQHARLQLEADVSRLESTKADLTTQVHELQTKLTAIQDRETARQQRDAEAHQCEVTKYTTINDQLKANLESILAAPRRT